MSTQFGWEPPGPEWEPGEPLYDYYTHGNSHYFFNFRDSLENEGYCGCIDAAGWPEPRGMYRLSDKDEFADFIDEYHELQELSA